MSGAQLLSTMVIGALTVPQPHAIIVERLGRFRAWS